MTPTGTLESSLPDSFWAQSYRVVAVRQQVLLQCSNAHVLWSCVASSDPQLQYNKHPSSPVFASLTSVTKKTLHFKAESLNWHIYYQIEQELAITMFALMTSNYIL